MTREEQINNAAICGIEMGVSLVDNNPKSP